jgi:hypothetical protein
MVDCDRCHRNFKSYAALKQQYGNQHSNAKWPDAFENQLIEEKNLQANLRPTHSSHTKLIIAVILIVIVVGASGSLYFTWSPGGTNQPSYALTSISTPTRNPTKAQTLNAAIIDQVSADLPNTPFVNDAEQTLTSSGLVVKYFAAADVTVDFYKRLPSLGYRLIVWRVHSAISNHGGIAPFTSEPYDASKYGVEQLTGSLVEVTASLSGDTGPYYFGIGSQFVTGDMEGNFGGAIIILSSCNGLIDHIFADALIQRGASTVISWNNLVSITHTDMAASALLKALVQGSTVSQAVKVAMDTVGPDPTYGSVLGFYPLDSAAKITLNGAPSTQTNAQATSNLTGVFILSSKFAICFV